MKRSIIENTIFMLLCMSFGMIVAHQWITGVFGESIWISIGALIGFFLWNLWRINYDIYKARKETEGKIRELKEYLEKIKEILEKKEDEPIQ